MAGSDDWFNPRGYTRNEVLKAAGAVAGGVGVMGLLSACGGDDASSTAPATGGDTATAAAGKPVRGGTLNLSMSGGTPTEVLDPARLGGGNENLICGSLFDRLLRFDDNFVTRPELAESWESNADATKWTFKLRTGLKFSDGSPLTAKDVKSTVDHILDEQTGSSHFSVLSANLKPNGIEVVDDTTIVFNLYAANGVWPLAVGDKYVGIVKTGTADDKVPVGAGPFMIKNWTPGQNWEAVRNPNYWDTELPYLDAIRGVNVSESATLVRSLTSGSADLVGPIDFGQAKQAETGATKMLQGKNASFIFACMDSRLAPFDDPKVAEAVKIAVNRQAVVNSAFNQFANPTSDVLLWPENSSYPKDLGVRDQDIEKAKALLSEAGHADGIDLELFTSSALGGMVDYATIFAQVVEPAGIRIKIRQANPATYFDDVTGKKPFFVNYTAARSPLYAIARFFVSEPVFPFIGYSNPEVDELYAKAFATPEAAERDKLTAQAIELISEGASVSIPCATSVLMGAKKNVEGVQLTGAEFCVLRAAYVS